MHPTATTGAASWCGWVSTASVNVTSATGGYFTPTYAYPIQRTFQMSEGSSAEPEPCTDEELEEFLFGGA